MIPPIRFSERNRRTAVRYTAPSPAYAACCWLLLCSTNERQNFDGFPPAPASRLPLIECWVLISLFAMKKAIGLIEVQAYRTSTSDIMSGSSNHNNSQS